MEIVLFVLILVVLAASGASLGEFFDNQRRKP